MSVYKILLVDDEMALRFLLAETLSGEGYEITEAEDGQEAVDRLRQDAYHLIILDYMMPERTGVEVCEWLRNSGNVNQDLPVILLTAKALEKDKEKAKEAGVTTYIVKPFSPLKLAEAVKQLLEA
jgi:CheY-like chemotaxis protein